MSYVTSTMDSYLESDEYPSFIDWYIPDRVGLHHCWCDISDNIVAYWIDRDFGDEG